MYDVCIVGAGPAGSTLARLIGDRYRVLLVDGRRLDRAACEGRGALRRADKACGGLLAPKAQRELARQGLGVPAEVLVGPQLFAVRTVDLGTRLERTYQRHYLNVDRGRFDRWLVSLVPSGVDAAFGFVVTDVEVGPGESMMRLQGPEGAKAGVVARLVVGADGARSIVRRLVCPGGPRPAVYAAVQATFGPSSGDPYYGAIFSRDHTDHYGWTIPKGDSTLVGLALRPGSSVRARFEDFVARCGDAGLVHGSEIARASATVLRPSSAAETFCGAGSAALVGEAAGFVSPSSAEGVSYALRSARLLARALEPGIEGAVGRYASASLRLKADVAARAAKAAVISSPRARHALMRTGLGALDTTGSRAPEARPGLAAY